MSLYYVFGFCIGIIFAVFLIIFFKRKINKQYDERQKAVQGIAYKIGFFAMFEYFMVNGLICTGTGDWLPAIVMNFIGIGFGVVCYAGYAIFNDAYISINSQPLKYLTGFLVYAVINYLFFIVNISKSESIYLLNLICAVLFTLIPVMIIIKVIIDKIKAGKESVK